ncbi:Protein CBG01732 [Caenorhabditis briggsae]|uniref:Protein CBG01732 n=2 Tax=Caenorhabditis briggsae TaxID=6238 RepID=A8WQZ4_CAEBR|nr:Protein CBG01732 [Caenorhabditis briggsae]ULT96356.1 hypothetical protein L3Y34_004750 [Caenorhabditis briggsae]CAP22902.1 Protein CBG01732 [Caenorhabditis briggsae]
MGFKLVALSSWLLTVSTLSIEHNAVGGGCIDLLCPDTASLHGLRNLVNEDTLKTDACTDCKQCTENGYSVCLRPKDSRASRTSGGCSCSHTLAANCHTDLTQTQHPANLSMKSYSACYADALQRPPQPLAVNENSSVVVTIEPFWLEPYWRHLKIENVTLHYKFQVKAPEHCEHEVESTEDGVHTCVASVLVDLSESKEDQEPKGAKDEEDDYDHSDNYDQYDDDLPPEVQFDRDVFAGAKELESYYTATIRRTRQIKASASKNQQIYDGETLIESEHLKFDLKPELYGNGEAEIVDEPSHDSVPDATEESATVVQEDKDEGDVSNETGGTNFFEEEEKKEEETKKKDGSEEEDGVLKVNLEDVEPTKLKSQEDGKKKKEEDGDDEEKEEDEEVESTTDKDDKNSGEAEKNDEGEEEKKDEQKEEDEEEKKDDEEETTEEGTTVAGEDSGESNEDDSEESTTVELIEGETDPSEQNFWQRFVNSEDFPRCRNIFIVCVIGFIIFCAVALGCLKCCCKSKESKTSNGYHYTSANQPPTELVSREKEHLRQ